MEVSQELLKYEAELASDFRRFFSISIYDIGTQVSWAEAFSLIISLAKNLESSWRAAFSNWSYPASREALALMDLVEIKANENKKKGAKHIKYMDRPYPKTEKEKLQAGSPIYGFEKAMAVYSLENMNVEKE